MVQRQSQKQKQKMSARVVVAVAASSILAIIAVLFFVFNIGNVRHGFASSIHPKLDIRWKVISNDGKTIRMEMGIRTNTANENLGPSSFVFKFDPNIISFHSGGTLGTINVDYIWASGFGPGTGSNYSKTSKVTQPKPGNMDIILDLAGGKGTGISNTAAYTPIIDIIFTIVNRSNNTGLKWAMSETNRPTFDDIFDDSYNPFDQGTINDLSTIPTPPIQISLTGELKSHKTELNWSTSIEYNNAYFIIQRGLDGINFDSVQYKVSNGASQSEQKYVDFDSLPVPGNSYYRIILTDIYGNRDTSNIISINNNATSGINPDAAVSGAFAITSISPTTFQQSTNINYTMPKAGNARMVVTNTGGKTIMNIQVPSEEGENTYRLLNAGTWEPGVYIVTMYFEGQSTFGKMVKE